MSIEDYDYIDENENVDETENEENYVVVFVQFIGKDIDNKNIYHFYTSANPEVVFAEGWGEVPACNVPRNLMIIDKDMYDYTLECKTDIKLDLAQDCCCFSMQDARDNIVALAFENLDNAETYPEPRIIIHYGDKISEIEHMFAQRDVALNYIE